MFASFSIGSLLYYFSEIASVIYPSSSCICVFLQRIKIPELLKDEWFKKGYKPTSFTEEDLSVDDVAFAFNDSNVLIFGQVCTQLLSSTVGILLFIRSLWFVEKSSDRKKSETRLHQRF